MRLTLDQLQPQWWRVPERCASDWPAFVAGVFAGIGILCVGAFLWNLVGYVRDISQDYPQRRQMPDSARRSEQ